MSNKCKIKIYYKEIPSYVLLNEDIFKLKNHNTLRELLIKKSNEPKQRLDVKNIAVQKDQKFIIEFEEKIAGIGSIYNEKTFSFFLNKIQETKPKTIKAYIVKVDKYPEWNPPQVYKILESTLKNASNEIIDSIKKDLTQEDLENGGRVYIKEKNEEKEINEETYKNVHAGIFCNICQNGNFFGLRYVCAECNNFNLCENCYLNENHTHCQDHTFIRIKEPIRDTIRDKLKIEINKFNCIFTPNRIIEYKPYEAFDLEVELINNGIYDLSLCFISPIRFGKKYLGCNKTSVTESVSTGEKFKMNILVKFEDETGNEEELIKPLKEYEGYFRLMTYEGIPFGDILYLKVIIQN